MTLLDSDINPDDGKSDLVTISNSKTTPLMRSISREVLSW